MRVAETRPRVAATADGWFSDVLYPAERMTHDYVLWIAIAAYGFHMIEETIYDWHGWVRRVLKLQAEWSEFYMVNAIVFVLALSCAMVGWRLLACCRFRGHRD